MDPAARMLGAVLILVLVLLAVVAGVLLMGAAGGWLLVGLAYLAGVVAAGVALWAGRVVDGDPPTSAPPDSRSGGSSSG